MKRMAWIPALLAGLLCGCGGFLDTEGQGDGGAEDARVDHTADAALDGMDVGVDGEPDTSFDPGVDPEPGPDAVDVSEIRDTLEATEIPTEPPACVAGTERCLSGDYQICRSDGSGWDTTVCDYDCLDTPTPHCGDWDVSNIGMDVVDDGTGALGPTNPEWQTGTDYLDMNTLTGEIEGINGSDETYTFRAAGTGLDSATGIHFTIISQGGGAPDIGVFSVASVNIPSGVTVWSLGDNAFSIAATGAINIAGKLHCMGYYLSGDTTMFPGPGGGVAGTGPGAGKHGAEGSGAIDGGGGGAGYGGAGGSGGPGTAGGGGGSTYGTADLRPIWGGSGGGNGADHPGIGGPGGGACELVSLISITVASSGGIDASAHGGDGGDPWGGGGGAGSGGALLLESPTVTINGLVAANGGGGGSGAVDGYTAGQHGQRGQFALTAAAGGVASGGGEAGCDGGDGNTATDLDGKDNYCEGTDVDGGGGGGGAGRIRINGMTRTIGSDTLSPAMSTTATTQDILPLI